MVKFRAKLSQKLSKIRKNFKVWKPNHPSSSSNLRITKKKTNYRKLKAFAAFALILKFWLGSPKLADSSFQKCNVTVILEKINQGGANFQAEAFEIISPQVVNP